MFPVIRTIDDVLPHIKDYPEFFVADKEGYRVINYMVAMPSSFGTGELIHGDMIRRECRGIMFDYAGNIIRRPLHKFFNYGEKPSEDTKYVFDRDTSVYEKLDGSMIVPFIIARDGINSHKGGTIRLGTKMGVTDVSLQAEVFIKNKPHYMEYIRECLDNNFTPIFEWVSRKQRIVIDYPEDNLILTAVRNMHYGDYLSYSSMMLEATRFSVPIVDVYELNVSSMNALQEHTKTLIGMEGFVVSFPDDRRVKLKADDYLRIHKAKDQLTSEKNVLQLIFNDNIDDTIPHLYEEDQKRLLKFEEDILHAVNNSAEILKDVIKMFKGMYPTRKDYGLNVSNSKKYHTIWSAVRNTIAFKLYDNPFDVHDVRRELIDYIKKNINTSTKIEDIRHVFGYNRWNCGEADECSY